ncbi:MAG TPA: SIMPL domain-containing protein [Candidatus Acidoferrum sp.]|nr:SIMPL domain-containing protein [Candidatus Acidoferrum sp.]
MNRYLSMMLFVCMFAATAKAQTPEIRFVADTLVVQAEGSFESDPDLATLAFDVSSQDKDLKVAYTNAAQAAQRIVALATKTGLAKEDINLGTLTLAPSYERDRKNRAKSYRVQGDISLKVRDFSQIGPLLDGAVQEGIVEFRSLTYSLQDEEGAKQKAVAAAMRSAVGRATSALTQSGQKLGAVRYANLDVRQLVGVTRLQNIGSLAQTVTVEAAAVGGGGGGGSHAPTTTFPAVSPEKITVSALVQCAFQIQSGS